VRLEVAKRKGKARMLWFTSKGERRSLVVSHGNGCVFLSALSYSEFTRETLPPSLPAALLRRNDELTIGGWAMNTDDPDIDLTCQYCFPAAEVTPENFRVACLALVEETHELDESLEKDGLL
jgi:hypothetical protein